MLHCHRNCVCARACVCVCVGMSGGTPCKKWWRRRWPKAIFSRWRSNSRRAAAVSSNKKRRRRTRHRRRRALPQTGLFPSSFHPSRPAGCNSGPLRDSSSSSTRNPRIVEGVREERTKEGTPETARGTNYERRHRVRGIITPLMT